MLPARPPRKPRGKAPPPDHRPARAQAQAQVNAAGTRYYVVSAMTPVLYTVPAHAFDTVAVTVGEPASVV